MITYDPGDVHIVISHSAKTAKAYNHVGNQLWEIDALTQGVGGGESEHAGNTPLGDYRITRVVETQQSEPEAIWMAYGKYFIALDDLEHQESREGRSGVGWHGGGTVLGPTGSQGDYQQLVPTEGCIRSHNRDFPDYILPTCHETNYKGNKVIVTVKE